jgi:membrane-associated protease RseP (regulator of RpoE activity)
MPAKTLSDDQKKKMVLPDRQSFCRERGQGAAFKAGLLKGDVIVKLNDIPVNTGSELVGQIAIYRPGDQIKITYLRNGKEHEVSVILMNSSGNMDLVKNSAFDKLGAQFQSLPKKDAEAWC